jgi:hypothetical protein
MLESTSTHRIVVELLILIPREVNGHSGDTEDGFPAHHEMGRVLLILARLGPTEDDPPSDRQVTIHPRRPDTSSAADTVSGVRDGDRELELTTSLRRPLRIQPSPSSTRA